MRSDADLSSLSQMLHLAQHDDPLMNCDKALIPSKAGCFKAARGIVLPPGTERGHIRLVPGDRIGWQWAVMCDMLLPS